MKHRSSSESDPQPGTSEHLVVLGAGSIGSLFAGRVWSGGGVRVTLVTREVHARAINERGLLITRAGRPVLRASGSGILAVTDLRDVQGTVDYLLVAVKSIDLDGALERAGALQDRLGCVFSLQNGVDHGDKLGRVFGSERVLGAVTMEGAELTGPGVVEHLLASTTYIGEADGHPSVRTTRLAETLGRGMLTTEVSDDIAAASWTKFVQSCAASGVCGVTRLGYAPATRTLSGATLYVDLVREGVMVMRARGLEPREIFTDAARIRDIAGMPVDRAIGVVRTLATRMIERGYVGSTSLARDLQQGRPTEVEALMGAMYRAGEAIGLPMPNMKAVYLAIKTAEDGGLTTDRAADRS